MQSRMDKYQTKSEKKFERSQKNIKLYDDVYDDMYRDTTYKNMQVIDSAKEINLNKLKDILTDKYDTRQYRTFRNYNNDEEDKKPEVNNKVYDINEIINQAKSKRAFIEETKEKQKFMDFTQRKNISKEDEDLKDLINKNESDSTIEEESLSALDILSDLKGNDNTIVTDPINSYNEEVEEYDNYLPKKIYETTQSFEAEVEKTLIKADKTFYTDSNMFTKNDFEDFADLSKSLSGSSKVKKFFVILFILLILGVIAYFVATKFILK